MPYCAHCKNIGLCFTDHWLKDGNKKDSKIICPVLCNTICKFCKQKGHTISYCEELKKKDQLRIMNTYLEYKSLENYTKDLFLDDNLVCQEIDLD
jgi:hypothetical protein